MEGISIKRVSTTDDDYQQVYDLREAILRRPIGLSLANEDLSKDQNDIILAAYRQDKVIGCVMLQKLDKMQIKLRQMAVSEEMQGKGIGNLIIAEAEKVSKEEGYNKIVLHARAIARDFYSKAGYAVCSDEFDEVGIPHYAMEKDI
jgi:predicted GNAT family N-acyltransferase